jgi:3-oxoacyl-[acyl-carrier-protein] synthase-3
MYARIAGTGSYLPEKILTNADLEKIVDTSDEWIRTRTGISQRHIVVDGETTSDLAEHAARRAMADAGVGPEDVDLICVGTTTPDFVFPNVGTLLQSRLGIHGCPAFSLEAACAGFLYALSVADKFVRLGESKCALVVGAETLTRMVDWSDRGTCVLFADGAGAVILKPADEPGILSTHLHADGRYKDLLLYPDGVSSGFHQGGRAHEGQRSLQGRRQYARDPGHRNARREQGRQARNRLADTASGEHPHHRGDREAT